MLRSEPGQTFPHSFYPCVSLVAYRFLCSCFCSTSFFLFGKSLSLHLNPNLKDQDVSFRLSFLLTSSEWVTLLLAMLQPVYLFISLEHTDPYCIMVETPSKETAAWYCCQNPVVYLFTCSTHSIFPEHLFYLKYSKLLIVHDHVCGDFKISHVRT